MKLQIQTHSDGSSGRGRGGESCDLNSSGNIYLSPGTEDLSFTLQGQSPKC